MSAEPWEADLPPGHLWIARMRHGQLIAIIDEAIPTGSAEERLLAAQAEEEWQRGTHGGLMGLPVTVIGLGGWALRQLRKPPVAAATAFGTGAAAAFTTLAMVPSCPSPRHAPPQAAPALGLPPVGHRSPPRIGPPKSGPPTPARVDPKAVLPETLRPSPPGRRVTVRVAPSLPSIAPVRPSPAVTVTVKPPAPADTCRVALPNLLPHGVLCGRI